MIVDGADGDGKRGSGKKRPSFEVLLSDVTQARRIAQFVPLVARNCRRQSVFHQPCAHGAVSCTSVPHGTSAPAPFIFMLLRTNVN